MLSDQIAAIARLAMTEQVLLNMKRMLNLRAHAGLDLLQFFLHAAQFARLFAGSALRFERFIATCQLTDLPSFRPLFDSLVAGVPERGDLIAMPQRAPAWGQRRSQPYRPTYASGPSRNKSLLPCAQWPQFLCVADSAAPLRHRETVPLFLTTGMIKC